MPNRVMPVDLVGTSPVLIVGYDAGIPSLVDNKAIPRCREQAHSIGWIKLVDVDSHSFAVRWNRFQVRQHEATPAISESLEQTSLLASFEALHIRRKGYHALEGCPAPLSLPYVIYSFKAVRSIGLCG